MPTLLLALRVVLVLVLGVAAVAKLRDRGGTAGAAEALGVPRRFAGSASLVLPAVELCCAMLLFVPTTARVGAVASAALFASFTGAVARTLSRGERPECRCFGGLSDEPIGTSTLVRNGSLLILAVAVAVGGDAADAAIADVVGDHSVSLALAALGLVVLALVVALVILVGDHRALDGRVDALEAMVSPSDGIAPGRPAPDFALPDLEGTVWTLGQLVHERPVLLVFTDAKCVPCAALMPDVADWSYAYEQLFRIVVLASGGRDANLSKRDEYGLERVLLQRDDEIAQAYRYRGTPAATLVGVDGTVIEPMGVGTDGVRELVARVVARSGGVRLPVGISAPPFHAHDVGGGHVDNAVLVGSLSVVLFWDEACSFCRALDDDLMAILGRFEPAGVKLVVASASGGVAWSPVSNVRVVRDTDRTMAVAFGSPGTPSAILVDADGRIASAMSVGRDEVLAVVGRALRMGKLAASFPVTRG